MGTDDGLFTTKHTKNTKSGKGEGLPANGANKRESDAPQGTGLDSSPSVQIREIRGGSVGGLGGASGGV
jgi:hypothetical protein